MILLVTAEQYASTTGQHPRKTTSDNINMYRTQLDRMGFGFDWSREIGRLIQNIISELNGYLSYFLTLVIAHLKIKRKVLRI